MFNQWPVGLMHPRIATRWFSPLMAALYLRIGRSGPLWEPWLESLSLSQWVLSCSVAEPAGGLRKKG